MLIPKKTKYRKSFKFQNLGKASRGDYVSFGSFGLKAQESSWITSRQIEAARKVITKFTKKGGKMWIRIFPDKPVTKKGGEIPMGKGKGAVDHYIAPVKAGTVIFEIDGVPDKDAQKAMRLAAYKLPIKCKITER